MEKEEMGSKTHVLIIPFPLQGHINPMLQFSKRLASKGVKITLLVTPTINNSIQPHPTSTSTSINIQYIIDGDQKNETMEIYVERFKAALSQSLPELIEKQSSHGYPIKFVIYDSIMPWILDIAQPLGVNGASFFTQSAAVSAIYYHLHEGNVKIPLEESTVSLPSMPLLGINDLPSYITGVGAYPSLLRHVVNRFSNFQKSDCLLFNTFDHLEDEVVKWMSSQWAVKTIGPAIPSMYLDKRLKDDKDYGLSLFKSDAKPSIKWLDTKENKSVIYVSFGSLASLGDEQMEELAWGLMKSKCHFLWVVRASEQNKLPSNFIAETSNKGLIVSWGPQLEVLAHRAVGCFMTHCGWNSTLEALSLGLPMLVLPQWADQTTNAKYIADVWGVGVRVKVSEKGIASREEIEIGIKEVMEGERGKELKRMAVRWKELAREAVDEGGSSDKNMEEFVSKLVSNV